MCVEAVGYLLEELRNPETLEAFKRDVESANIFIGSLIFVQELAEKVVEVVKPLREKLDAVLIFPSMPDVMRLNKVSCCCRLLAVLTGRRLEPSPWLRWDSQSPSLVSS